MLFISNPGKVSNPGSIQRLKAFHVAGITFLTFPASLSLALIFESCRCPLRASAVRWRMVAATGRRPQFFSNSLASPPERLPNPELDRFSKGRLLSFRKEEGSIAQEPRRRPASQHVEEVLENISKQGAGSINAYASVLRECGNARALADGNRVHAHIVETGHDGDRFLGNLLVQMYGKCGQLASARAVFNRIADRNLFSWTIMLTAYAQNGHPLEALHLYRQMHCEGVKPDSVTFINVLSACASLGELAEARWIHEHVAMGGFEADDVVVNSLVNLYGKCRSPGKARIVFEKSTKRDVVSWNSMIGAYAQNDRGREAIELYNEMGRSRVKPNEVTFTTVLDVCSCTGELAEGMAIHASIAAGGFESDAPVANALISMYGKCGSLDEARKAFDKIRQRDVVSWTAMIAAYAQNGHDKEALQLYRNMGPEGVKADNVTYVSVLDACSSSGNLAEGKEIHAQIVANKKSDSNDVANALATMYSRCGSLDEARNVFDEMQRRNLISWNAMVAAYVQNGQARKAVELYREMLWEGVRPDHVTLVTIIGGCSSMGMLAEGRAIHACILASGLGSETPVANALINMYGKCEFPEDARSVFDKARRTVVSWNAMISAYTIKGRYREALELYRKMDVEGMKPDEVTFISILDACSSPEFLAEGKSIHARISSTGLDSDVVVGTALVSMYGKCGVLDEAKVVFEKLGCGNNVISWTALITAYAQNGHGREALELYTRIEHLKPDCVTFVSIVDACTSIGALREGREIHSRIVSLRYDSDTVLANALVFMYGKCGSLDEAMAAFRKISCKTTVSWNTIIKAYAQNGQFVEALSLSEKMALEGVKLDEVTFVTILFACSHAGVVNQGWQYFVSMGLDHRISGTVEHYVCMVDLLGRAGRLAEAEDLMEFMPFQPDYVAWMTLLGACCMHSNVERGIQVAERVFEMDPQVGAPFILLSNMYAAVGKWDEAAKVRKMMEERGLKKLAGHSAFDLGSLP